MFCYQCQEAAKGTGCDVAGVCGKTPEVANLQDLLIYTVKGISEIAVKGQLDVKSLGEVNEMVLDSLFKTITNANFDAEAITEQIKKNIIVRDELAKKVNVSLSDASTFKADFGVDSNGLLQMAKNMFSGKEKAPKLLEKAEKVGVLSTENEDVRSLRELITYGVKGYAAYTHHALKLGKEDFELYAFVYEAMAATLDDSLTADDLVALTLKTGEYGIKVWHYLIQLILRDSVILNFQKLTLEQEIIRQS